MTRRANYVILALLLAAGSPAAAASAKKDVLLRALKDELARSFPVLRGAETAPLYYMGYEARDTRTYDLAAFLGAVRSENERHSRHLDVDMRVGDYTLDSTHQFKGNNAFREDAGNAVTSLPVEDDPASLRAGIWMHTDLAYKTAQNRYLKVRTNKTVTAEEEDPSDDFSREEPARHYDVTDMPLIDKEEWRSRLRRLSAAFKKHDFLIHSGVHFSVRTENRYIVNSEGTEVVTGNSYIRLTYTLLARTEDGMDLDRFRNYDAVRVRDLPSDDKILRDIEDSIAELAALYRAPIVQPYTGPAIIRNRAAAVFFHEILGHRLEGHRQKLEDEGQTFAKKLGQPITADFISVYDDATLERFAGQSLRGFYRYDDEGVEAREVTLVKDGVLKGFLLSRSPIKGFANSNGHGRRGEGQEVTARMGNTRVHASKTVTYTRLREMLIEEIKRQGKPYGLIFEDIGGGFTNTGRSGAQSFKVLPKLVYRVYPDGRPDEAVRGADIVGTPLNSFAKILAAADDYAVFNGTCGAESGWVPVSGVAPSLLIAEVEVEKNLKNSARPPILPSPHHDGRTAP
ncbi:MAG: metallopeptidase TldD-related protein [Elusimicrobiota bacterium]